VTGPKPRKRKPTDEEAELMVEAYGEKGAALRKTAAGFGKAQAKADANSTSLRSKIKRFLKRTTG